MRKMRKAIVTAFFFSGILAASLPAQSGFTASLGVNTGLIGGQAEEIVYINNISNNLLSQLLWDMKPIFYLGTNVDLAWKRDTARWGFFIQADGKFGVPGKTGIMEDRDWLGVQADNTHIGDWLTHYSVHTNNTEAAVFAGTRIGAARSIGDSFTLKLYADYSFKYFSWSATGGSFLYPESSGDHQYQSDPSEVIHYTQAWHTIAPGISFGGVFNRYFSAEVALGVTPLIWCIDVDDHILRNLHIYGVQFGGVAVDPSFVFTYTPTKKFALSLNVAYRYIAGTRGNAKYDYSAPSTEDDFTVSNQVGTGYNAFDVGLVARFKLR